MERVSVHTFEAKNKIADDYSEVVKEYFKNKGIKVIDLEGNKLYQKKDIDFILKKGSKRMKVELKSDTYIPRNFYIETVSNVGKDTEGCFLYTESDYILYGFINHGIFYMIPTVKFQAWFNENEHRFSEPNTKVFTPAGKDGGYYSKGKLVPVDIMVEELGMKKYTI